MVAFIDASGSYQCRERYCQAHASTAPLHVGIGPAAALRRTARFCFIAGRPSPDNSFDQYHCSIEPPPLSCLYASRETNQELSMTRPALSLDLSDARRLIAAAERKAIEIGVPYNVAVADAGGGLIAHARMDGAWLGSVDIAINKAWTARAFDMSTDDLSHLAQSGQQGFGINTTNDSRVVIFGGGIPVKRDGIVIGAVGASGGSVAQDIEVAKAAVAGFAG
jgi:uncharacterized protein GlcG (DUF336 family)